MNGQFRTSIAHYGDVLEKKNLEHNFPLSDSFIFGLCVPYMNGNVTHQLQLNRC